jgi:hypothetical protein
MATTTTTTCDKCGHPCPYGCVRIDARTEHWTGQREMVGEDFYQPRELCLTCGKIAVEMLGMTIQSSEEHGQERPAIDRASATAVRPLDLIYPDGVPRLAAEPAGELR